MQSIQTTEITSVTIDPILNALADKIITRINSPAPIKTLTFGELYNLYFERHVKIRLKNWENAFYFYKNYGGPRWGKIQVHEIKRCDVQAWIDEIGATQPATAVKSCNMLSIILNWGMNRDFIPEMRNPCKGVQKFKLLARERFIQPDELKRFQWAVVDEAPVLRDFFWMCLLTAARRSNVLSMAWDEIDMTLGLWRIPPEKFKTGDSHTVALNSMAMDILSRRSQLKQNCWVFPGYGTKNHLKEPKRAWARVLKRANITDLHIHDMRRSMASYLAMQGENQYVIGVALGHKDVRSSAVYARLNLEPVRTATEKVCNNWQQLLALPAPAPVIKLVANPEAQQSSKLPQNTNTQISSIQQVIIEGKILTAIGTGGNTKKGFYKKIGGQFQTSSSEMERILSEMIDRKLIERYRDDKGIWRYALACKDKLSELISTTALAN